MSATQLRTRPEDVMKSAAAGDLRASAHELLSTLGYSSNKTLDWPTQPQTFTREVEALLGGSNQLNAEPDCLADWKSVVFLSQPTNEKLPTFAAGQLSFFTDTGVQPYQIESFIFRAVDLKASKRSRARLARIARELNRPFSMPVTMIYRHTLLASSLLRRLRDRGLLEKLGVGSRTHYALTSPGEHVDHDTVQAELPLEGGKRSGEGGKPDAQGGKRTLPDLPLELAARLPKPGQRLSTFALRQIIRDLCGWQPLRGEELATLLHKDLKYLRNKHLPKMMQGGELAFLFPESPSHALQAYTLPTMKRGDSQ